MSISRILFLTLFATMLVACATTDGENSAAGSGAVTAEQKAAFDEASANAKSVLKKAEDAGYAWRDTGEMLKKAQEKFDAGDVDGAMKLVNSAKHQSENALEQAAQQKNAGPRY